MKLSIALVLGATAFFSVVWSFWPALIIGTFVVSLLSALYFISQDWEGIAILSFAVFIITLIVGLLSLGIPNNNNNIYTDVEITKVERDGEEITFKTDTTYYFKSDKYKDYVGYDDSSYYNVQIITRRSILLVTLDRWLLLTNENDTILIR